MSIIEKLDELYAIRTAISERAEAHHNRIEMILEPVTAQLDEENAKYSQSVKDLEERKTGLESEIKALVVKEGTTIKSGKLQAVYRSPALRIVKPEVLEAKAQQHPWLKEHLQRGEPSVSIREEKKNG